MLRSACGGFSSQRGANRQEYQIKEKPSIWRFLAGLKRRTTKHVYILWRGFALRSRFGINGSHEALQETLHGCFDHRHPCRLTKVAVRLPSLSLVLLLLSFGCASPPNACIWAKALPSLSSRGTDLFGVGDKGCIAPGTARNTRNEPHHMTRRSRNKRGFGWACEVLVPYILGASLHQYRHVRWLRGGSCEHGTRHPSFSPQSCHERPYLGWSACQRPLTIRILPIARPRVTWFEHQRIAFMYVCWCLSRLLRAIFYRARGRIF